MAEENWITTRQAARLLGLSINRVATLVSQGHLYRRLEGRQGYLRLEEVEQMARDPDRLRRNANRERKNARRRTAPAETGPADLIDRNAVARMLGMKPNSFAWLIESGQLCVYEAPPGKRRKHHFSAAEVQALQMERNQRKEEKARRLAERDPPAPRRFPSMRRRLSRGGRIEVDDISEWERYFGEWITTRQAAMLLHITRHRVCRLRESGKLSGVRQETLVTGRVQWHYRKADVLKLMCEPKYFALRARYEQSSDPVYSAEKKKAESEANWDACWRGMQAWRVENG